jgi:hypothetical protein
VKYLKKSAPYLAGAAGVTLLYAAVPVSRILISKIASLWGGA